MLALAKLRMILPQSYPLKNRKAVTNEGGGSCWTCSLMVSSCSRKICRAPKGTRFPHFHSLRTRQLSVLNPTRILLQVHVPLNVHQNHWMLMMFNFDKKEIQTLNSMNYHCDKTKEDSLVSVLLLPLLIRMAHELPKYRNPMYNSSYPRWTRFSSASTKLSRMG